MQSSNGTGDGKPMMILGLPVYIPPGKTPFPAQLAVMSKVILAAKDAKNALLESPTGTGKTLAFLCSSLAFQSSIKDRDNSRSNDTMDQDTKIPVPRRGMITEQSVRVFYCTRTHSQLQQIIDELKKCHPIYLSSIKMALLASRTQYCINDEIKVAAMKPGANLDDLCRDAIKMGNCPYRENHKAHMRGVEILQGRQVYDIEDAIGIGENVTACPYYINRTISETATYFLSPYNYIIDPHIRNLLRINLNNSIVVFDEAHNIEDVAREAGSFETFANRLLMSMGNLKSFEKMFPELSDSTQTLIDFLSRFNAWVKRKVEIIEENSSASTTSSHTFSDGKQNRNMGRNNLQEFVVSGSDAMQEWSSYHGITFISYRDFTCNLERIMAFIDELLSSSPTNSEKGEFSMFPPSQEVTDLLSSLSQENKKERLAFLQYGLPKATLEFLRRLSYIFDNLLSQEGKFGPDYRVIIRKQEVADNNDNNNKKRRSFFPEKSQFIVTAGGSKYDSIADQYEINFWCMTGKVVFEPIFQQARSVIFTSGTLHPMDSFEGEFDVSFPVRVEANHVINLSQQLLVGAIQTYQQTSFLSTYDCQQSDRFLDTVGNALIEMAQRSPGGTLLFVPSYALLARLKHRWIQTRSVQKGPDINSCFFLSNHLNGDRNDRYEKRINVYFEPKKNEEMNIVLDHYYNDLSVMNSQAVMVAVCRGKISEGINFSDHYARTVIVLGIPFPSIGDRKVQLKMQYQDIKFNQQMTELNDQFFQQKKQQQQNNNINSSNTSTSTNTMGNLRENATGRVWYKQQALRAVNQAIGRCIRHIQDFGCIVLLDPRFAQDDITASLSRWMRSEVRVYEQLEDFLPRVDNFFHHNPSSSSSSAPNISSSIIEGNVDKLGKSYQKPNSYHNMDKLNKDRQEKLQRRYDRKLRKQEKQGNTIYDTDSIHPYNKNADDSDSFETNTTRKRKIKESIKLEYEQPHSSINNNHDTSKQSTTSIFPILKTPAKSYQDGISVKDGENVGKANANDSTYNSPLRKSSEKKRFSFASGLEKSREVVQARSPPFKSQLSHQTPELSFDISRLSAAERKCNDTHMEYPAGQDSSPESMTFRDDDIYFNSNKDNNHQSNIWSTGVSSTAALAGKRVVSKSLFPANAQFTYGHSSHLGESNASIGHETIDDEEEEDHDEYEDDGEDEDSMDKMQLFVPNTSIFPTYHNQQSHSHDAEGSPVSLPEKIFMVTQHWHLLPCPHLDPRQQNNDTSSFDSNVFAWLLPQRLTYLHRLFSSSIQVDYIAETKVGQNHVRPLITTVSPQHLTEKLYIGRIADKSLAALVAPHASPLTTWRIVEEWVAEDNVVYRYALYHDEDDKGHKNMQDPKKVYLIAAEIIATTTDTNDLQEQIFLHPQVMLDLWKGGRFSVATVREVTNTNESLFA